jgi:hypothetical protein
VFSSHSHTLAGRRSVDGACTPELSPSALTAIQEGKSSTEIEGRSENGAQARPEAGGNLGTMRTLRAGLGRRAARHASHSPRLLEHGIPSRRGGALHSARVATARDFADSEPVSLSFSEPVKEAREGT